MCLVTSEHGPDRLAPHRDTTTTANRIRLPAEPVTGTWDRGSPLHWGLNELGTLGSRAGPGPRETPGLSNENLGNAPRTDLLTTICRSIERR